MDFWGENSDRLNRLRASRQEWREWVFIQALETSDHALGVDHPLGFEAESSASLRRNTFGSIYRMALAAVSDDCQALNEPGASAQTANYWEILVQRCLGVAKQ